MWTKYYKKSITEIRSYVPGEDMSRISVSPWVVPQAGGFVCRNPEMVTDQWCIEPAYFDNYAPLHEDQE